MLVQDRGGSDVVAAAGQAPAAWSSTASSSSRTPRRAGSRFRASVAEPASEGPFPAPPWRCRPWAGQASVTRRRYRPVRQHPRPLHADREGGTSQVRCVPRNSCRAVPPAAEPWRWSRLRDVQGVGADCGRGPVGPVRGEGLPGLGGNRPGRLLTVTTAAERDRDDRAKTGRGCCCRSWIGPRRAAARGALTTQAMTGRGRMAGRWWCGRVRPGPGAPPRRAVTPALSTSEFEVGEASFSSVETVRRSHSLRGPTPSSASASPGFSRAQAFIERHPQPMHPVSSASSRSMVCRRSSSRRFQPREASCHSW